MGISLQDAQRNPRLAEAMNKQPKRKPVSRKNVKDNAWDWFSRVIRLRDAMATTGNAAICKCITCGKIYPTFGGQIQAGHWLGGRAGKNLFDPRGVHAQCARCNK
jgi:hypothetical protein